MALWFCLGFFILYLSKICSFKALRLKVAISDGGLRKFWTGKRSQHIGSFLYFMFLIQLVIVTNPVSRIAIVQYRKQRR